MNDDATPRDAIAAMRELRESVDKLRAAVEAQTKGAAGVQKAIVGLVNALRAAAGKVGLGAVVGKLFGGR